MKISRLYILLFLFLLSSAGCEKQNLGGLNPNYIYQFDIPNVISPNASENNVFYVQLETNNPEVDYAIELMEIFDRYGNLVYQAEQLPLNDPTKGWDGTYDGDLVESGVYSYSVQIGDAVGSVLFTSDFTVLY